MKAKQDCRIAFHIAQPTLYQFNSYI